MDALWNGLGLLTAVASAAALYAASPHARWRLPRGASRGAGALLAAASLAAWIHVLGVAVGICAMLAVWMLALAAWPWLGLLAGSRKSAGAAGHP